MYTVNDDGHARDSRRQTPEDAGLAGVGVHDIGSEATEGPHELAKGLHVAQRRDRMHQAGQFDDLDPGIHRGQDLRVRLRAVDEDDIVPGAHRVVARDDGILVRAAVQEPCDDMRNPEWAKRAQCRPAPHLPLNRSTSSCASPLCDVIALVGRVALGLCEYGVHAGLAPLDAPTGSDAPER